MELSQAEKNAIDLEIAYQDSCMENGKEKHDLEFFRAYAFSVISLLNDRIKRLEQRCRG